MDNRDLSTSGEQASGKYRAIHPAVVHFSITLFPVSAIFLMLWFWRENIFFLHAAYWSFMFAALGALIAGGSGIFDYFNAPYPKYKQRGAGKSAKIHIVNGVVVTVIALCSAIFFLLEKPMDNLSLVKWFALVTFLESFLVIVQGFLGGLLVYTYHFGIEPHRQES